MKSYGMQQHREVGANKLVVDLQPISNEKQKIFTISISFKKRKRRAVTGPKKLKDILAHSELHGLVDVGIHKVHKQVQEGDV